MSSTAKMQEKSRRTSRAASAAAAPLPPQRLPPPGMDTVSAAASAAESDPEAALKRLQTEASGARKAMRSCNIEVIETTKTVRPAQVEYKKQLEIWEAEDVLEAERLKGEAGAREKKHKEDSRRAESTRRKTTSVAW